MLTKCQTVSLLIKKAGMILNILQTQLLMKPFSEMDCKVFFQWTPSSVYDTYSLNDGVSV